MNPPRDGTRTRSEDILTADASDAPRRSNRAVHVRRARQDDAEAVAAVWLDSFRAGLPSVRLAHSDEAVRRWIAAVVIPGTECWVAVVADRVVGMMALSPGSIDQLYVAPDRFAEGIGRRLVELAKTRSDGPIELWTFQVNQRARRFYERNGFVAVELTDGARNEEQEPDIRYRWAPEAG